MFYVDSATGHLVSKSADIQGKVVANEGKIGGWIITENEIYNTVGNSTVRVMNERLIALEKWKQEKQEMEEAS